MLNAERGLFPSPLTTTKMDRPRLDTYDRMPADIEEYLKKNGWSFSKKMCEYAVSRMKDRAGNKVTPLTQEQVDKMLATHGVTLKNDNGYDAVYVANMARADYWGSAIADEQHLVMFVRDYIDDPDGYKGLPFTRYFAALIGSGTNAPWEELL